jgi:hypothetical protein
MAVRIQIRRGLAAQWTIANPILADGELAAESDTGKFKIGNGVDRWNDLDYANSVSQLGNLSDVMAVDPADGSILVYNVSINKWVGTKDLTKQNMDGGHF